MDNLGFVSEVFSRQGINTEIRKDTCFTDPNLKGILSRLSPPEEREIVVIESLFGVKYILFRYKENLVEIGPFLTDSVNEENMDKSLLESYGIDINDLKNLQVIQIFGLFRPLLTTLFDSLWGKGNYSVIQVEDNKNTKNYFTPDELEHFNAAEVSRRYKNEARLLDSVRRCDFEYLEKVFGKEGVNDNVEKRNFNPVRNIQNYSIIMNTLLRKTAYDSGVEAIYVDRISSYFGKKIETVSTSYAVTNIFKEMVTEYACLIRDYSWNGYPESIKSVLFIIDSRYKEKLSLEELGNAAGLSSYYLSRLFKKVLGINVIEYLNKVRVNKSLEKLKDPDSSIAQAAVDSGFEDQAYYTRIFKKIMGMTPSQWKAKVT